MREIKLTDEELLLLDGRVNPDAQLVIESAKKALEHASLGSLGAEVIRLALEQGQFKWNHTSLSYCSICKKSAGYAKYKSGRNRGGNNYKRPLYFGGIEFMRGFVSIKGFASNGGCHACVGKLKDELIQYILDKNLPVMLPENTKWLKEDIQKCYKCNTEFGNFSAYLDRTIMGDGFYYCGCPVCDAESRFLGRNFETVGHKMVPISEVTKYSNCWTRRESGDVTVWGKRSKKIGAASE